LPVESEDGIVFGYLGTLEQWIQSYMAGMMNHPSTFIARIFFCGR
jgi:hypothetical protein